MNIKVCDLGLARIIDETIDRQNSYVTSESEE